MNLIKGAVWTIGLSALLVFAVACGKGEAAQTPANGDVQAAANGAANVPTDDTGSESPAASIEPAPAVSQPVVGVPAIGVPAGGSGKRADAGRGGRPAGRDPGGCGWGAVVGVSPGSKRRSGTEFRTARRGNLRS